MFISGSNSIFNVPYIPFSFQLGIFPSDIPVLKKMRYLRAHKRVSGLGSSCTRIERKSGINFLVLAQRGVRVVVKGYFVSRHRQSSNCCEFNLRQITLR